MDVNEIPVGQAWTGKINDIPVAIFNDGGSLIVLENICTHLKCQTEWDSEEKTWDCPCHGSRYKADGTVISGPARKPLKRLEYKIEDGQIKIQENG